jgi:SET and MYND domain-containing protein 4
MFPWRNYGQRIEQVDSKACKNADLSTHYRNEGNSMYQQSKFYETLESYNKSLMSSKPNSLERAPAFANRSAVYFEVKQYQLCLDNIQLARDSGYPVEKQQILKDREEKCKKLMEKEVKSDDDDPWTFFKLSYPANAKIPFIVDCLELQKDKKFGRHIVTNRG